MPMQQKKIRSRFALAPPKAYRANFFILWSFCLFAFLMPLENVDPFGLANVFSVTKMAGVLFAFCCLFKPKLCLACPPKAFWCFAAYLLVYVLIGLFYSEEYGQEMVSKLVTLGMSLIMFLLFYNLMKDDRFVSRGLLAFAAGCVLLSFLMLAGFGVTVTEYRIGTRVSALNENANVFGFMTSLGLLMLVGLLIGRSKIKMKWALMLSPVLLILLYHIIQSGSRGAMLCFAVGILTLLYRKGNWQYRLQVFLVVAVVLIGGSQFFQQSESTVTRWRQTIEERNLSGRGLIWTEAIKMCFEEPILGWGPIRNLAVLAKRCGHYSGQQMDTHNDILWVMSATGLAGTIPFAWAVVFCVQGAWQGRKRLQGALPLALIMAVLAMSFSGTIINRKATWMVLAYAAASAAYTTAAPDKRALRLRVGKR